MEHRRVCFCMLSLLPLVQISKLSRANSLLFGKVCCRTPRGVRGLKYVVTWGSVVTIMSHPSRGAWIEIRRRCNLPLPHSRTPRGVRGLKSFFVRQTRLQDTRRTPRGVRGLKSRSGGGGRFVPCRTPRGVRGLKYGRPRQYHLWAKSHPSRGAWIEMEKGIMAGRDADAVAPLAGCVD